MLAVVHNKISDDMKRAIDKPSPNYTGMKIGYARVSTDEQSLDLQVDALKRYGCLDEHIHVEKVSGVAKKRPKLESALIDARPGDIFVVWKMDRLGRSTRDLLEKIDDLRERGIAFVSLTEGVDFTSPMGKFQMHMFAGWAEFERDMIISRTRAGQEAARERGVQIGHDPKIDRAKAERMFKLGKSVREVAEHFGCVRSAIYQKWTASEIEQLRIDYLDELAAKRAATKGKK